MILDKFRLDDKTAIVTGAGKGCGYSIAHALAQVGARVLCVARTQADVDRTVDEIRAQGGTAAAVAADVTDEHDRERIIAAALDHFGRIDVLVNNAGGTGHGPTAAIDDAQVYQTMQVNFMAPVYLIRAAVPHMREAGGGAVVNISSGMSRIANIGSVPYGGAKAAQEQATRMLAMEYSPEVRINALRLGAIRTKNMEDNLLKAMPGIGEKLSDWTPVGRLGEPDDIAAAVVYLATPASGYVTGKILDVDGGMIIERSLMEVIATAERLHGPGRSGS